MDLPVTDKIYYKIGEVARIIGVKTHILRYWESEFPSFKPVKGQNKQRLYRRKDIDILLRIKDLLYAQGLTIAGAKKKLRECPKSRGNDPSDSLPDVQTSHTVLCEIRSDLKNLRDTLVSPVR